MKQYEFFYTNGSSHTKGGGFEEPKIRPTSTVMDSYNKKYGVTWKNRDEVNWATRLANNLQIGVVNEAECGGGLFRGVRMAYKFIEENMSSIGKFFILLEVPEGIRLDIYFKPKDSYYIVNVDGDKLLWATQSYFSFSEESDRETQEYFSRYLNLHTDWTQLLHQQYTTLAGFYSYCKMLDVPIKLLNNESFSNNILWNICKCKAFDCKCQYKADMVTSPIGFATQNKCCIWDEVDENDGHPGYFGHIKYAKFLKYWLDKHL